MQLRTQSTRRNQYAPVLESRRIRPLGQRASDASIECRRTIFRILVGPFMCFGSKWARADRVTTARGAIPHAAMRVIDSATVAHPPCLTRQYDGAARAVRTARKSLARSHESPAWTIAAVWIAAIRRRSDVAGAQQGDKRRGEEDAMGFHDRGG